MMAKYRTRTVIFGRNGWEFERMIVPHVRLGVPSPRQSPPYTVPTPTGINAKISPLLLPVIYVYHKHLRLFFSAPSAGYKKCLMHAAPAYFRSWLKKGINRSQKQ